ncbi:MAG: hypothetical protein HDR36_09185 [Treponema sp.]|nr:hypothetical protein [Treponema sp.]
MRAQKKTLTFLCLILMAAQISARKKTEEQFDFYELAKSGSARVIQKALKKEKSAASARYGANNDTLLMVAIEAGREESFLSMLLDSGVPPDDANDNGDTALIYAAKFGYGKSALKTLLSYAASPAKKKTRAAHRNNLGQKAADFLQDGTKEKKFLERYAEKEVKKKKPKGAAENPQKEIEENFIQEIPAEDFPQAESNAQIQDEVFSEDENPLETNSSEENRAEEFSNENPDAESNSSEKEISQETESALQAENISDADAKIPEQKKSAETAPKKRRENMRIYLFEGLESFDTYIVTEQKFEPIKNPDAKDENERTLLQSAAAHDDIELVTRLLASGANVNLTDSDGWSALMYAARFAQKSETTSALIKAGANVKAKNKFGSNALEIAAVYGTSADVLDELASHFGKKEIVQAFFAAVGMGRQRQILEVFFRHGITANIVHKGKTPLMLAAQTNTDTDCIEFLLERGADKTFVTADRKDAYYFAKRNPNLSRNDIFWSLNNSEK